MKPKSLNQILMDRLYAAQSRRNIGGCSRKRLHEGVTLDTVTEWFKTIYSQIDSRIDQARNDKDTKVETDLRNFRAILRDYEPRPGMDSDEATGRMSELYTAMRHYPEEYSGTFRAYIQKVVDQVDKAAKAGIEVPKSAKEPTPGEEFGADALANLKNELEGTPEGGAPGAEVPAEGIPGAPPASPEGGAPAEEVVPGTEGTTELGKAAEQII